jgi:cytochrome c peroxidase
VSTRGTSGFLGVYSVVALAVFVPPVSVHLGNRHDDRPDDGPTPSESVTFGRRSGSAYSRAHHTGGNMRGAATRHGRTLFLATAALWSATSACAQEPARVVQALSPDREAVQTRAQAVFAPLPDEVANPENPVTDAKVVLGRTLYFDPRLSKNHDISCNSCHPLGRFGADGESTSPGHRGQRGGRNSPTVYNAAVHLAQFWDGRAADVEAQAKGPILNPIEMAMPSEAAVLDVLDSIPGYAPLFAAAFPDTAEPITYDNLARAIGAFERRLLTPTRFDAFLS